MRWKLAALLLSVPLACSPFGLWPRLMVEPPAGFAAMAEKGVYRAVSPEGLPYRVRTFENKPEKTLAFWSETLKYHLQKEGYRLNGEGQSFLAGEAPGMAFEWLIAYGNETYLYLTAVIVTAGKIILAEAAGPYPLFIQYRQGLKNSLQSIRLR